MATFPYRFRECSPAEIRRAFHDGRFEERAQLGEFTVRVKRSMRGVKAPSEPPGTVSQILEYVDAAGIVVGIVHQYLRP
jgi:hypothetical protein